MANMDIAESRRPQDGRILFRSKLGRIDLRISTYPTLFGEKTVMRLLNLKEALYPLSELGFKEDTESKFNNLYMVEKELSLSPVLQEVVKQPRYIQR